MKTQELHYPSFRRWVGKQTGAYQIRDTTSCPLANWAREKLGFKNPGPGFSTVREMDDPERHFVNVVASSDFVLFNLIAKPPMTYEALEKRLDAAYTKTGLRRRDKRKTPARPVPYPTVLTGSFKRGALS